MSNSDPFQFKRKRHPVLSRTFKDDEQDAEVTLALRKLDSAETTWVWELTQEYVGRYITGETQDNEQPLPFPFVDGEAVRLSKPLLQVCCAVWAMQQPDKKYSVEALVAMSVAFGKWAEIVGFMNEVQGAKSPNASGVSSPAPSGSPNDTPDSTPASTDSSAQSMIETLSSVVSSPKLEIVSQQGAGAFAVDPPKSNLTGMATGVFAPHETYRDTQ